ncbi:Kif4 type kinesin [Volvox carteri f. nagariensis]|uniref:Kif4 type kinesin n=1 Tax=Volvox carteri f. nagariensis TaxID=3068 RepID=D8UGC5_VOLCA|nr:Kif4 type kinesin [Volvox carteri f. nagariensis]EFJ41236.1 Kif4 type kinesin [Volvox carteri f. nagariensis]|eukprot:XP_002957687.1 Kif4 type kinesin [Volvox carteri f. nagariensis]
MRLKMDLEDLRQDLAAITDKWQTAQAQCDLLRMNQAAAAAGLQHRQDNPGGPDGAELPMPGLDIVKGYVARIAELEAEVKSMKSLAVHLPYMRRRVHGLEPRTPGGVKTVGELDPASPGMSSVTGYGVQYRVARAHSMSAIGVRAKAMQRRLSPGPASMLDGPITLDGADGGGDGEDDAVLNQPGDLAVEEEEIFMAELAAHTLSQEKMKKEVALLQRQLEAKERKMVELMVNAGATPALKQHYDRAMADLEAQRDTLVAERKALMELRHQEREYARLQKIKQRTEDAHRRLSADIIRLKQQKVAVQKQLEANAKQFAQWRQERERELGQLRKQSRKDRAQIQHLQAMAAKQSAVLQRKISDATAARKRIKELEEEKRRKASQPQATAAVVTQPAGGGNVEIQPNAQAPLLRTDKERREWLQRELEMCNMSCEFRKVIDGELAQRAEATRKLKELEKRLTYLDQTQPASPLLMAGGHAVLPFSPNTASTMAMGAGAASDPEYRQKLLTKKRELEEKVAYHNEQITELQADWERQKAEEESRGGGALDPRRWTGLRTVAECRELLRTLFRMSVESKTLSNELTVDMVRYMEEVDVLRVQLDGAQKKSAQYRKLAITLQAAAAHVAAAPPHSSMSTQDETDKQVDAVLEALNVVRNNTPSAVTSRANRNVGLATTGGGDVEMQDAGSPDTPATSREGPTKALEFLSPVPRRGLPSYDAAGGAMKRYSPDYRHSNRGSDGQVNTIDKAKRVMCGTEQSDHRRSDDMEVDEGIEVKTRPEQAVVEDSDVEDDQGSSDDDDVVDNQDDDEEEEEDEEDEDSSGDEDSDGDRDWNPKNATPAPKFRSSRASRRSLACVGAGNTAGGSRRNSRRPSPTDTSSGDEDKFAEEQSKSRRGSRIGAGSRRGTTSRRNSDDNDPAAALEAPVLDDINLRRMCAGGPEARLQKLTVAALKEALKGKVIDGQKWVAGSKTRATMIQDYRRMLGLDKVPSQHQSLSHSPDSDGGGAAKYTEPNEGNDATASRRYRAESSGGGGAEISVGGAKQVVVPHVDASQRSKRSSEDDEPLPNAIGAAGSKWKWHGSMGSFIPYVTDPLCSPLHDVGILPACNNCPDNRRECWRSRNRGTPGRRTPLACCHEALLQAQLLNRLLHLQMWAYLVQPPAGVQHGQSTSPNLPRPPTGPGGFSPPSSSMGSPTPRSIPRSAGRPTSARMYSPGMSPDSREQRGFLYSGGENMQPDVTTPRGTMNASSEGKRTPLTSLYKEKAAAARERSAALRVSMQKNWEHQDQQHLRGSSLNGATTVHCVAMQLASATARVAASEETSSRKPFGAEEAGPTSAPGLEVTATVRHPGLDEPRSGGEDGNRAFRRVETGTS